MKRRSFLKNLSFLPAGAVAVKVIGDSGQPIYSVEETAIQPMKRVKRIVRAMTDAEIREFEQHRRQRK